MINFQAPCRDEDQPELLSRFYNRRGEFARGLGLAIVQRVARQHGGDLLIRGENRHLSELALTGAGAIALMEGDLLFTTQALAREHPHEIIDLILEHYDTQANPASNWPFSIR
jgi:hypothetical protein